jgi:hypothetical protein
LKSGQKHRMTHQRQVIFEEIMKMESHPTADEVYERVRKRLPRISMGTVYRNLDILTSSGLINRIEPGHSQMRFEGRCSGSLSRDLYPVRQDRGCANRASGRYPAKSGERSWPNDQARHLCSQARVHRALQGLSCKGRGHHRTRRRWVEF